MVLEDWTSSIEVPRQTTSAENLSFKKSDMGVLLRYTCLIRCCPRLCHPSPGESGNLLSLQQSLAWYLWCLKELWGYGDMDESFRENPVRPHSVQQNEESSRNCRRLVCESQQLKLQRKPQEMIGAWGSSYSRTAAGTTNCDLAEGETMCSGDGGVVGVGMSTFFSILDDTTVQPGC